MRTGSFMMLVFLTATIIVGCSKKTPVAEGEADKSQVVPPANADVRKPEKNSVKEQPGDSTTNKSAPKTNVGDRKDNNTQPQEAVIQPKEMRLVDSPLVKIDGGTEGNLVWRSAHRVAFSPDGRSLLVLLADPRTATGHIGLFDVPSGKEVITTPQPWDFIKTKGGSFAIGFDPDLVFLPRHFANTLRANLPNLYERNDAAKFDDSPSFRTCSPSGRFVAIGGNGFDGGRFDSPHPLVILDLRTVKQVNLNLDPKDKEYRTVGRIRFSPDDRLATISDGTQIKVWDLPTGKCKYTLPLKEQSLMEFSPDGKTLMTATRLFSGDRNTITLWDTESWKERCVLKGEFLNFEFKAFSQNGKHMVTSVYSSSGVPEYLISLYDVYSGKKLWTIEPRDSSRVIFTSDGKLLITGGRNNERTDLLDNVNIWDFQTGQLKGRITEQHIQDIAISPDCKTLATASARNGVRLWDITQGKMVAYEDELQADRKKNKERIDPSKDAPPITKAKYDEIKVGMTRFDVVNILGGKGETVRSDTIKKNEGKFGYSVTYIDEVKYKGITPGSYAIFRFQGASTNTPLVEKSHSGLK